MHGSMVICNSEYATGCTARQWRPSAAGVAAWQALHYTITKES